MSSFTVTVVHSVQSRTLVLVSKYHLYPKGSTVLGKIGDAMAGVTNDEMSQSGRSLMAESNGVQK